MSIATIIYFIRMIIGFLSDIGNDVSNIETIIALQQKIVNKIKHGNDKHKVDPVPLDTLKLPKIIFVKFSNTIAEDFMCNTKGAEYVLLGELAQMKGYVALMNVETGKVFFKINSADLYMVPITEY